MFGMVYTTREALVAPLNCCSPVFSTYAGAQDEVVAEMVRPLVMVKLE